MAALSSRGATDSEGAGDFDVYLVRLDASGTTVWTRTIGGSGFDCAYDVDVTFDTGFVVAGETMSYGAGKEDMYLIKTDALGFAGAAPK